MKMNSPKIKCFLIAIILFAVFVFSIVIPFVINESYKSDNGYITLWQPADTLAFYGSYLSFIGTVVLGAVSIYQNKKAHKINEQLQKLQQAQFVSMVSATRVHIGTRSSTTPNF